MKDNPDNNNKDQNKNENKRNSANIPISFNSAKIVNKQFTSEKISNKNEPNFIKRNSPIQPMSLFNLNPLKEESNNSFNTNQSNILIWIIFSIKILDLNWKLQIQIIWEKHP